MSQIFLTDLFKWDLDKLDKVIQERVVDRIRQLQADPRHPGLNLKKVQNFPGRKVFRARVNRNFRLLGEWLPQGDIRLWRVGSHSFIDAVDELPFIAGFRWVTWNEDEQHPAAADIPNRHEHLKETRPFKNFPINILRLFGVPDDQLQIVKRLHDPEAIWDLSIPQNVKWTLYDILTKSDWTADSFLDTKQLLYRTTVDQLEGYCEGKIKRLLLNLNDEQMRYVHIKANGPVLIKGVAGSGKTTIGLYRTHQELTGKNQKSMPMFARRNKRILLLTYTKTLTKSMEQLYEEHYDKIPHNVTISTISAWMRGQLGRQGFSRSPAKDDLRIELIKQAQKEIAHKHPDDKVVSRRSAEYLLDEIDKVIRARWLTNLTNYKMINRVGRGVGLDRERHRPIVWEIYQRYQQLLDADEWFDWADLPRLVHRHCYPLPQYDAVIIDEAQDLPPSHLHLASRLIPDYSESRSLTLLADPAQSIYYRGIPWKEAGIDIRGGRTQILAKNFRNTQQILEAARHILEGCSDLKAENEYIPPTSANQMGPMPALVSYQSDKEAIDFVIHEVIKLCQSNHYRLSDIAILSRTKIPFRTWQTAFRQEALSLINFRADDFHILENDVKFITMHSAKGLEFPVVFVIDLSDDRIPRIDPLSETKAEDELQERKLFYVSMTRAAERLYLLHPRYDRSRFIRDLNEVTVTKMRC